MLFVHIGKHIPAQLGPKEPSGHLRSQNDPKNPDVHTEKKVDNFRIVKFSKLGLSARR